MSNVVVRAYCTSSGVTASSLNSGSVTLSTGGTGCGLSGTLTRNFVNGVATFNDLAFSRSVQSNVTFTTSNTGTGFTLPNVTSSSFNITAPAGTPINTTIVSENFEGSTQWTYSVGTPTYTGSGGTANGNFMGVKSFTSPTNKALSKSYTANNGSGEKASQCTATFVNQTGLGTYNYSTFTFQLGSLGTGGSGDGNDSGEDMWIETSTDGGTTWKKLLTYKGFSNFLLPLSASSPASLSLGADVTYNGSTQSAFSVTLPAGTSQFMFRMTATNNRIEENWVIDNISLVGTTIPSNAPKALPVATGGSRSSCPITDVTLSAAVSNNIGTTTYSWSPTTNFTSGSVASTVSPVVNFASGSQTYTVTITDADACTASATNTVTITAPAGNAALASATITLQELACNDANGWTYYTDPADPTKWLFGIYKNGNTFSADVDLALSGSYTLKKDDTRKKATYTLGRYWNAAVATGSINPAKPIKVRFFYSNSELNAMTTAAQTLASGYGSSQGATVIAHATEWVKTITGIVYDPNNSTYSDVPNRLANGTYTTTQGTLNSIPYIEYGGLTGFSGGTAAIRVSPQGYGLPVTLIYLNATPVDNRYIRLDWATASEISNKGFALERSTDGINFEQIDWIDGQINSSVTTLYTKDDKKVIPNTIYYYRLRQIDEDGHFDHSNIVSSLLLGETGFIMEDLKPNPATSKVTINVIAQSESIAEVSVTDVLGQEMIRQIWSIQPGLNGTTLDLSSLASGTYQVTVHNSDSHYTKRLVVSR
jgi:hypothetical protein